MRLTQAQTQLMNSLMRTLTSRLERKRLLSLTSSSRSISDTLLFGFVDRNHLVSKNMENVLLDSLLRIVSAVKANDPARDDFKFTDALHLGH